MLSKDKINRINELARKSKITKLSDEEKKEQNELRKEYIKVFREDFKAQLECIEIIDPEMEEKIEQEAEAIIEDKDER